MKMWGYLLSIIISSIISVVFSDKIIEGVTKALVKIGIKQGLSLSGKWKATFYIKRGRGNIEHYTEIIELKKRFGLIW